MAGFLHSTISKHAANPGTRPCSPSQIFDLSESILSASTPDPLMPETCPSASSPIPVVLHSSIRRELLDLPQELLIEICLELEHAPGYLKSIRQSCHRLRNAAIIPFGRAFFAERFHAISQHSLSALLEMSANREFGRYIKTLGFNAVLLPSPSELRELGCVEAYKSPSNLIKTQVEQYNLLMGLNHHLAPILENLKIWGNAISLHIDASHAPFRGWGWQDLDSARHTSSSDDCLCWRCSTYQNPIGDEFFRDMPPGLFDTFVVELYTHLVSALSVTGINVRDIIIDLPPSTKSACQVLSNLRPFDVRDGHPGAKIARGSFMLRFYNYKSYQNDCGMIIYNRHGRSLDIDLRFPPAVGLQPLLHWLQTDNLTRLVLKNLMTEWVGVRELLLSNSRLEHVELSDIHYTDMSVFSVTFALLANFEHLRYCRFDSIIYELFWHGWVNNELKAACEETIELEGDCINEELKRLAEEFRRLEGDWTVAQQRN